MAVAGGFIGILVLIKILVAVLPSIFTELAKNSSYWGSFASLINTLTPLVIGVAIVIILFKMATGTSKGKGYSL